MQAKQQIQSSSPKTHYRIENILYATDLSAGSDEALKYSIELALIYDAKLFLNHSLGEAKGKAQTEEASHAKHLFEESVGSLVNPGEPPLLKWEGIVSKGKAADVIVREAKAKKIDLIVMRSRRRLYAAAVLGSTAESVCHNAPCPVLITHPKEREWVSPGSEQFSRTGEYPNEFEWKDSMADKARIKRILVATDFSNYSKIALECALSMAQAYRSELNLLHVLPADLEHAWAPIFEDPLILRKEYKL